MFPFCGSVVVGVRLSLGDTSFLFVLFGVLIHNHKDLAHY